MLNSKLFFDEMNILRADKDRRHRLAMKMKKSIEALFIQQLAQILLGSFLTAVSSTEYREELFDIYILMVLEADKDLASNKEVAAKAKRFADYIEDTTEKTYQNAVGNERFELSRQMGISMLEEDIPDSISKVLSSERTLEIACNEANWIYNYIQHDNLVKSGQLTHTWSTQKDEKVRLSHIAVDDVTLPINRPFIVGGYEMMFPLDDSRGAPASEICGCRCVEI